MIRLKNISTQTLYKIVYAFKSGKINADSANELGLTTEEIKDIISAFISGNVIELGEYRLFNMGRCGDDETYYFRIKSPLSSPNVLKKVKFINYLAK